MIAQIVVAVFAVVGTGMVCFYLGKYYASKQILDMIKIKGKKG